MLPFQSYVVLQMTYLKVCSIKPGESALCLHM